MRKMEIGPGEGLERLRLAPLEARQPGPGEIAVRIEASSLNFGDHAFCTGVLPLELGRVPLWDGAGVVQEVGSQVEEYKVGDRVVATFYPNWIDGEPADDSRACIAGVDIDGFACEQVVRSAAAFTHAPKGWTSAEAATLTCAGVTAWRPLVSRGGLRAGEWVLVQGTGGVSMYALMIAKALGANVVATSSSETKLERLKEMGADILINYREEPEWGVRARELTGGVDHVVDIGGEPTLGQSLEAIRNGGAIYTVGLIGGWVYPLPLRTMSNKEARMIGGSVGSRTDQLALIAAIERHGLKPVLDKSFDLSELADAFRYQEAQKQIGKITISI